MAKEVYFDIVKKDFGLNLRQQEIIIEFIHSLILDGASMKRVYNEITTENLTQKQLYFALFVMGFYVAMIKMGVIIDE